MPPNLEQQIAENISEASRSNNEYEKTISLQIISLATFLITLIGAFISLDTNQTLNTGAKIVVLLELLLLFTSVIFGIIHLLITKNMFRQAYLNLTKALKLTRKNQTSLVDNESLNIIAEEFTSTTMVFFYLQLSTLSLSLATFIGLIIYILFR